MLCRSFLLPTSFRQLLQSLEQGFGKQFVPLLIGMSIENRDP